MATALAKAQVQEDAFCETEQGSEDAAGADTASTETASVVNAPIRAQNDDALTQDAGCYGDADYVADSENEGKDDCDESDVMTTEELLSVLDQALKEVRLYLDGKLKLKTAEEFLAELECEEGGE